MHIWANKYEGALQDVFAIQSEVAEKIVRDLKSKLLPSEKAAIEQPPTNDVAAYDLYVHAKTLIANALVNEPTTEDLSEAVRLLEQAVKRDPSFYLAYLSIGARP